MIAILICTGLNPESHGLDQHQPAPMLPVGDRPFLQHLVEWLALQGVRQFEFVLSHLPEKIEDYFGDGQRWGCQFHFHLCPDPQRPYRAVRNIVAGRAGSVLLGHGERLPLVKFDDQGPVAWFERQQWTGWGCFAATNLHAVLSDSSADLSQHVEAETGAGRMRKVEVSECLRIDTPTALLESQRILLEDRAPGLMLGGNKVEDGVWVSRNVSLHPTARLEPPVFIGANCRIAAGTRIGPCAVIGENCIIDEQSTVTRSLVTSGTYIGEALELEDVIVDRNRLVNTRIGTSCLISETFLVGSLTEQKLGSALAGVLACTAAWLLLAVLWPVLLFTALWLKVTRQGGLAYREFVALPAGEDPKSWKTSRLPCFRAASGEPLGSGRWSALLFDFVPGLWAVARGRLRLVGLAPRTPAQVLSMPSDWRSSYRTSKVGLVTEADLAAGGASTQEDIYSAEAFYSATASLKHDFKLTGLYFWRLLSDAPEQSADTESVWDPGA